MHPLAPSHHNTMKQTIMTFSFLVSLALTLLAGGCKDNVVQPPTTIGDTLWVRLDNTSDLDVRCLVTHNDELYLTANQRTDSGNYGYVLNTQDGFNWKILNVFVGSISPITFHKGDLFLTTNDSIWCYNKTNGWNNISKLPFLGAETIYDLFFLDNRLYIMANRFWEMIARNVFHEINYPERGGRFLVDTIKSIAYFRPWAYASGFYYFKDNIFTPISDGLSEKELGSSTVDAMFLNNNILYAGFGNPASIKQYTNGRWVCYTDSMLSNNEFNAFDPPLVTMPTVARMVNNQLFVGTNYSGVQKWDDSNKWTCVSNGLPRFNSKINIYLGINYLVYFKGGLYIGYGQPTFSPYNAGLGVYRLNILQ
jgi:hypothetical protein